MNKSRTISLSVTELVEFSARSGDLYPESAGGPSALEGVLAHQRIQRERGPEWQSEVALKCTWEIDGWTINLQGRLDLLMAESACVTIDEIKTTLQPLDRLPPGKIALFWAQVRAYAALYHLLHRSDEQSQYDLHIGLTLVNLQEDQPEMLQQQILPQEALAETERLLRVYLDWYCEVQERLDRIRTQAKTLAFPFAEYRPGQYPFAADIYRVLRRGGALLAEAPTGTGKTLTSLFPAAKALGEDLLDQVVYLTGKTTHQRQVENTVALLRENGLETDCLTLCARDKLCPCRTGVNSPKQENGVCGYTIGFWDRLPAARQDCLATPALDHASLTAIGRRHRVCPFALGLHLVPWSTLVIGDYNYFFDPLIRLYTFDRAADTRALLVDELHNLPERARAMFSAQISDGDIRMLAKRYGVPSQNGSPVVQRICRAILRKLRSFEEGEHPLDRPPAPLVEQLEELTAAIRSSTEPVFGQGDLLAQADEDEAASRAEREIYKFSVIANQFSEGHRCRVRRATGNIQVQLLCLNPAPSLARCYAGQKAVVGFSATLTPPEFYRQLTGLPPETHIRQLPYPFPQENLLTLRCDYIDTRWRARDHSRDALAQLLFQVIQKWPGKYLVFFPSYEYLATIHERFAALYSDIRTVRQGASSGPAQQTEFFDAFFGDTEPTLGFAILGGLFGEGVDYVGDALHGAIIVGTGMPQPGHELSLMAEHFAAKGLNPYEYVYQFPGFARVLQTAGRVIRSERDRGVVVLVDPRFARRDFRKLIPAHWRLRGCRNAQELTDALQVFWNQDLSTSSSV